MLNKAIKKANEKQRLLSIPACTSIFGKVIISEHNSPTIISRRQTRLSLLTSMPSSFTRRNFPKSDMRKTSLKLWASQPI